MHRMPHFTLIPLDNYKNNEPPVADTAGVFAVCKSILYFISAKTSFAFKLQNFSPQPR